MHLMHLGYGIGSFIVPLIVNPFLAVRYEPSSNITNITMATTSTSTVTPPPTNESEKVIFEQESRIEYAYVIVGVITLSLSVVYLFYHCHLSRTITERRKVIQRKTVEKSSESDENRSLTKVRTWKNTINPASCAGGDLAFGLQIYILVPIFFACVAGSDVPFVKFLRSFSVDYLDFEKDAATYLNSSFWISLAVGRFVGFVVARWISIRALLQIEVVGILATMVLMVLMVDVFNLSVTG